jgi:uncharacterized membrane protein
LIQRLLTALLVLLAVGLAVAGVSPMPLVLGFVPFAVIHGVRRYGWLGFSAYAAITPVVSFSLENLSIATGFPFGHYHYTAQGIPYLGTVPVQIGVIYVALGYVCWITASALLDGADQRLGDRTNPARRVDLVALPALAAALMASFDLGSDSAASTVGHRWIWEQGGGLFGVPWTNYVAGGWSRSCSTKGSPCSLPAGTSVSDGPEPSDVCHLPRPRCCTCCSASGRSPRSCAPPPARSSTPAAPPGAPMPCSKP